METKKSYHVLIGNMDFDVNQEKTHVYYGFEWRLLQRNENNDLFIIFRDKKRYTDGEVNETFFSKNNSEIKINQN